MLKRGVVVLGFFLFGHLSFSKPLKLDIKIPCKDVNFKTNYHTYTSISSPLPRDEKQSVGFSFFFNRLPSVSAIVDNIRSLNLSKTYQEPPPEIYTSDIRRHADYYEKDIITKNTYIRPTNKGNELVQLYKNDPQLDFGVALNARFK
ncbi:hypothetical protein HY04AAS1_0465 [Hydrogenobaculum sp. Y04AAS1]|uniref:hypothetical protein n=1 Tax=Hydrogenobaculum sp. (strain Y04AAS1) TaxID=380749 RepID=UPI00015BDC18|nr:hypothetical protein HY04AAS1_0465 [Hydrogenobaculum sp. Y04AAS1]HCT66448.1 hypothetical protein [Hydrogenobaculum sp.]